MTFIVASFLIVLIVCSSSIVINGFGAPKSQNFGSSDAQCWTETPEPGSYVTTCCWDVTDPNDPEGIELEYCQRCDYDPTTKTHSGCSEVTQERTEPSGIERLPLGSLKDVPIINQEPIISPPNVNDENKEIVPSTGVKEQDSQTNEFIDNQTDEVDGLPTIKNNENLPLTNDIREK